MRYGRLAVLLVGVLPLCGCASSGQTLNAQAPTTKLSAYKSVVVNVTSSVPDTSRETLQLESMIVSTLNTAKTFPAVSGGSAGGTGELRVNAVITDLRRVSSGARVMLGAFAGRGNMTVDVKLVDTRDGKTVGSFTSQGTSSGGTVFSGTTDQAVELAARQIVEFLRQNT